MTKINSELFSRIRTKFLEDNNAYIKSKLEISKWFFSFIVFLYFFLYLSTISGYNLDLVTKLLAWIYPVFLFSIFALLYDLIIYVIYKNSEEVNIYKIPLIIGFTLLFLFFVAIEFGLQF